MKGSANTAILGSNCDSTSELQPFLHLPLIAELPARIDAHVIFSAGALLDELREALRALAPHVVRRPHMAEPERLFRLGENLTFRADDGRGSADEHYRHSPREAAPCHLDGHGAPPSCRLCRTHLR